MAIEESIVFNVEVAGAGNANRAVSAIKESLSGAGTKAATEAAGTATGGRGLTANVKVMSTQLGGIAKSLTSILGIAAGFMVIIQASKSLQRMLGALSKSILQILRPIGDMLSIILLPLLMLIRPLGIFINALFRPFLTEARKAFRLGMKFFGMGMPGKGMEAMFAGIQMMALPITKLLVIAVGEGLKAAIDIIALPATILLNAMQALGTWMEGSGIPLLSELGSGLKNLGEMSLDIVNKAKQDAKVAVSDAIQGILDEIDRSAEDVKANIDNLRTLSDNMSAFKSALKDTPEAFGNLAREFDAMDTAKAVEVSGVVKGTLDTLVAEGGNFERNFGEPIAKTLQQLTEKASDFYDELYRKEEPTATDGGLPGGQMNFLEMMGQFQNILPQLTLGFGAGGEPQLKGMFGLFQAPIDAFRGMIEGIVEKKDPLKSAFESMGEGLIKTNSAIISTFTTLGSWIDKTVYGSSPGGFVDLIDKTNKATDMLVDFRQTMVTVIISMGNALHRAELAAHRAESAAASAQAASASMAFLFMGGGIGGFQTGTDYVPKTGIYKLHEGEKVTPAGGGGGTVNLGPVNIYALDANEIKRKLDELIAENMRKMA